MSFTLIGYIAIPILVILILKLNLKKFMILTFVLSTMTSTSVCKINSLDFALPIGYFAAMLMIIKNIYLHITKKYFYKVHINKYITIFIILVGLSLLIPIYFSKGIVVLTPDNIYEPIRFNLQIITQFMYLFFMYVIFVVLVDIMKNEKFSEDDFYFMIKSALILTIVLAILQYMIPIDTFNNLFRTGHSNNQTMNGVIRLTAATMEASILGFMALPMTLYILSRLFKKFKLSDLIIFLIMFTILLSTKSSTFIIGLITGIILLFIIGISKVLKKNKVRRSHLLTISLAFFIFSIAFIICIKYKIFIALKDLIIFSIEKIKGEGISGNERLFAFKHHINIFKNNFIFGVGFGTVRSYDLLSTWLSELGLVGCSAFFIFNLSILRKLIKKIKNYRLIIIICLNLFMMLISVPEPYFIFTWVYYAYGVYLVDNNMEIVKNKK